MFPEQIGCIAKAGKTKSAPVSGTPRTHLSLTGYFRQLRRAAESGHTGAVPSNR
jgi:hypothetical protein